MEAAMEAAMVMVAAMVTVAAMVVDMVTVAAMVADMVTVEVMVAAMATVGDTTMQLEEPRRTPTTWRVPRVAMATAAVMAEATDMVADTDTVAATDTEVDMVVATDMAEDMVMVEATDTGDTAMVEAMVINSTMYPCHDTFTFTITPSAYSSFDTLITISNKVIIFEPLCFLTCSSQVVCLNHSKNIIPSYCRCICRKA